MYVKSHCKTLKYTIYSVLTAIHHCAKLQEYSLFGDERNNKNCQILRADFFFLSSAHATLSFSLLNDHVQSDIYVIILYFICKSLFWQISHAIILYLIRMILYYILIYYHVTYVTLLLTRNFWYILAGFHF